METAPFRNDLAEGPEDVAAFWRQSSDGIRLRVTVWPRAEARGTILLFHGRTEYSEKYGRIARNLTGAGFALATIDWRGQGMSDRMADDPRLGHVSEFPDYQRDVAELVEVARLQKLPEPSFLIAHSMGGCIGLRALIEGLPVERAVFSAPMWGIELPWYVTPLPFVLPPVLRLVGKGDMVSPGTEPTNYITDTGFAENMLTTDRDTFDYLERHAEALPEFALGGPTVNWVGRAATECRQLASMPRPAKPVLTFLGGKEEIVSAEAIRRMHKDWPSGELRLIEGARHEVMMETPAFRDRFLAETLAFFEG